MASSYTFCMNNAYAVIKTYVLTSDFQKHNFSILAKWPWFHYALKRSVWRSYRKHRGSSSVTIDFMKFRFFFWKLLIYLGNAKNFGQFLNKALDTNRSQTFCLFKSTDGISRNIFSSFLKYGRSCSVDLWTYAVAFKRLLYHLPNNW